MAEPVQAGPIRLFARLRSDPFFADVEGALHGFRWTGHDDFAGNNVDSIALEVPSDMLGASPQIGVWATISLRRDGALQQMDRGGNPTINPLINPDGEKNLYDSRQPADDVAGVRPRPTRRLPQRSRAYRRRLQHALRLAEPWQDPSDRLAAARRPDGQLPP